MLKRIVASYLETIQREATGQLPASSRAWDDPRLVYGLSLLATFLGMAFVTRGFWWAVVLVPWTPIALLLVRVFRYRAHR